MKSKKIFLAFLPLLFLFSCEPQVKSNQDQAVIDSLNQVIQELQKEEKHPLREKPQAKVKVGKVTLPEREYKDRCFVMHESDYPEIIGLNNSVFQDEINENLEDWVNSNLKKGKAQTECLDEEEEFQVTMGWMRFYSSLDFQSQNLICIRQGLSEGYGGGNAFTLDDRSLLIDLKNSKVLTNAIFDFSTFSIFEINENLREVIERRGQISREEYSIEEFQSLDEIKQGILFIRNDSLFSLSYQEPGYHSLFGNYEVGLSDLKKAGLKSRFGYLIE